jgi:hypothetical protein
VIIDTGICRLCGQPSSVEIADEAIADKAAGYLQVPGAYASIQKEFPTLSPGVRETLLSGTHKECFDEAFGDDDDS